MPTRVAYGAADARRKRLRGHHMIETSIGFRECVMAGAVFHKNDFLRLLGAMASVVATPALAAI